MDGEFESENDHDQLFKQLIELFFKEFLWLFCPEEAALIDFSRVEFLRDEVFVDAPRGRRRRLDLVAKVGLNSGGEKVVLVHMEFESKRWTPAFSRRMFEYFCTLFLKHSTNVIAVAVFSDDAIWKVPAQDYFELKMSSRCRVRFDYHLLKLKDFEPAKFMRSNNPLAYALMAKMNYDRRDIVRLKADFLRLILGCKIDAARQSVLVTFVDSYMPLLANENAEFKQLIQHIDPTNDDEDLKNMMTSWEREGLLKGRQEGLLEGRQEGRQEALEILQRSLLVLLQRQLGEVSESARKKIESIKSIERLDALFLAAMDAKSISDLKL